jgi:hypothetical protein
MVGRTSNLIFVTLCLGGFWLGALLRGDHGEGGPALLDVVAGAVRADNPTFLIVDER